MLNKFYKEPFLQQIICEPLATSENYLGGFMLEKSSKYPNEWHKKVTDCIAFVVI